jgi:15-cis-phytoene synthase
VTGPPAIADPERALSLAYAPPLVRPALSLLWRLDEQLGSIVARTESPAVGQMRLTWWHDALSTVRSARPVDPLLVELAAIPAIDPASLLPLIDGWETLLDPLPLSEEFLERYADLRGGTLFAVAGAWLGAKCDVRAAGRLWALVDLAFRVRDRTTAERALRLSPAALDRLPGALAPLAALAARDVRRGLDAPRRQGSPVRVARALWAGLTGY